MTAHIFRSGIIALAMLSFINSRSLIAAIISTGNVEPDISSWDENTVGYVGRSSDGAVLVDSGYSLDSRRSYLGYETGASGSVTVRGAGSKWTKHGYAIEVGKRGTGTLNIEAGGQLSTADVTIAYYEGSAGAATVSGIGSQWAANGDLFVARAGDGSLTIDNGGRIKSSGAQVGGFYGGTGTVFVTSVGSQWDNGSLSVSNGSLTISSGGQVNTFTSTIGTYVNSSGAVAVTGSGSQWHNGDLLRVEHSRNGSLTVADGGEVETKELYASISNLHGDGSISVFYGAFLDADWRFDANYGVQQDIPFGTGGTLSVNWSGGVLGTGYQQVGSFTIADGRQVTSSYGYLGDRAGSQGTAIVTGTGSEWNIDNDLEIGRSGEGSLTIEASGRVTVDAVELGSNAGSAGSLVVAGADSDIDCGSFNVGRLGNGSLAIVDGGKVSSSSSSVGAMGIASVTGAGSVWSSPWLSLSPGASLDVSDGGRVITGQLFASFSNLSGDGSITVTRGAVLDADLRVDATHDLQQDFTFGSGGTLTVNWAVGGPYTGGVLGVGNGEQGSLVVSEGETVSSSVGYLGYAHGGSGTATVTGVGSQWNLSPDLNGRLNVGYGGEGDLHIEAGGQVNTYQSWFGYLADGVGFALVKGPGSRLSNTRSLLVGGSGSGNLVLAAGGQAENGDGFIGYYTGSSGIVTVRGATSRWSNANRLYIGDTGKGKLVIEAGGIVTSTVGILGHQPTGTGATLVTGPGSQWDNGTGIAVGALGDGELSLRSGGMVSAGYVFVSDSSLLSIDTGSNSLLSIETGNETVHNEGQVRVLAAPTATPGSQHEPIIAKIWEGPGTFQALGGTWDDLTHIFTVSETVTGVAGSPIALDLSEDQRVLVDAGHGRTLGASLLAKMNSPVPISFWATPLETILPGAPLSAWDIAVSGDGYAAGDPLYLSFSVDADISRADLKLWHRDAGEWQPLEVDDLTVNERYASFTATQLGGYALTAVPEPGSGVFAFLLATLLFRPSQRRSYGDVGR